MKTRSTVFAATVAAIVLAASFVMIVSDDSSASDPVFSGYYYNQLNTDEKAVYDKLEGLNLDSTPIQSDVVGGATYYHITVSLTMSSAGSSDVVLKEVRNAWLATKMVDPMAWWAWSYDDPAAAIPSVSVSSSTVSFKIMMTKQYAEGGATVLKEMVTDTAAAIDTAVSGFDFSSTASTADKIKAINSYLCGSDFKYDPAVSSGSGDKCPYNGTVYGAFVNTGADGKHILVCSGYAAAFQAICDKLGIPCLTVFGTAAGSSSNDLHAWNIVILESKVYGVDVTFDATGKDSTAYLCVGAYTVNNGVTFSQSHQPFVSNNTDDLYMGGFVSYDLEDSGYPWPAEDGGIVVKLTEFAPWIVIGLICALLAYVLYSIGKKGEQ